MNEMIMLIVIKGIHKTGDILSVVSGGITYNGKVVFVGEHGTREELFVELQEETYRGVHA